MPLPADEVILLENASATGDAKTIRGGLYYCWITGDAWAGATATLQALSPNEAWASLRDTQGNEATITNGNHYFELRIPHRTDCRGEITGGPPTNVTIHLRSIPD